MRVHAQTALIENGFVHIPETEPWLDAYLHELTVFPKGKHDDQVDSTAQFLDWFKRPSAFQGWKAHCQINFCRAQGAGGGIRDQAAATAIRHWLAASARKIRSVERETRWR